VLGCGGDDREAVLVVMEDAQTAVRERDEAAACRLLTDRGRQRVLGFGDASTCEAVVRELPERDPPSIEDVEDATAEIESIDGDRAIVRVKGPGDDQDYDVTLVKTDAGWRIDDSDAVPQGEN
jgi:hypothetical protein